MSPARQVIAGENCQRDGGNFCAESSFSPSRDKRKSIIGLGALGIPVSKIVMHDKSQLKVSPSPLT